MATSSSSSAKKVAKLAQRGKGRKVRFQGGSLFPVVVLAVIVVGLVTIVYARQSRPDPGSQPPQVGDHWHAAYGFYICDTWLPTLDGAKEDGGVDATGSPVNDDEYNITGVHSHDDGVIHWHPFSTRSVGNRAKLGLFLDVYDIELLTDELVFPDDQGGNNYQADEFTCDGEDVQITVTAWNSHTDTGAGTTYITDLDDIRLENDGMVFSIGVTAPGAEIGMPPWAKNLPELGAADSNQAVPTTVAGSDDAPTDDTATDGTATDDTATDGTATDGTATDDTATDGTATATSPADTTDTTVDTTATTVATATTGG